MHYLSVFEAIFSWAKVKVSAGLDPFVDCRRKFTFIASSTGDGLHS